MANNDQQAQIDELYHQIGQLKVKRDFLANRSAQVGLEAQKALVISEQEKFHQALEYQTPNQVSYQKNCIKTLS
jgi:hypothetical protein